MNIADMIARSGLESGRSDEDKARDTRSSRRMRLAEVLIGRMTKKRLAPAWSIAWSTNGNAATRDPRITACLRMVHTDT